jgi:type I restriction enzyme S subunit
VTYLAVAAVASRSVSKWEWVPLRRIARLRREKNERSDAVLLALSASRGVEPRPDDGGRQLPSAETVCGYWLVRPNDLVFNPMWAIEGGVAVSDRHGAVSNAYRVYELRSMIDPKFAHHWFRSSVALEQYRLLVRGVTTFDRSVTREDLEGMPVPVPPLAEQRAIAEFLDGETARVDALITAKRMMIGLLEERKSTVLDSWVNNLSARFGSIPLRRLIRRVEQGWSPECDGIAAEAESWGVLKTSAVTSGAFRAEENKRLPAGVDPDARWIIRDGDLLVIRGSGSRTLVGQAAVADTQGRLLLLSDLIYRLIVREADPRFLAAVLRSPRVRGVLESLVRTDAGQTLKVRGDDLRVLPVPAAPYALQYDLWADLQGIMQETDKVIRTLGRQIELANEHRNVYTSAVVTGETAVPRVAA